MSPPELELTATEISSRALTAVVGEVGGAAETRAPPQAASAETGEISPKPFVLPPKRPRRRTAFPRSSEADDDFERLVASEAMIGIHDVRRLIPLSAAQIDRLMAEGCFPQCIFLSPNRRAWRLRDILEFQKEREAIGQHRRNYSTKKKVA